MAFILVRPIPAFSCERKSGGRMTDPITYCIKRVDEGCFHFNTSHCNMSVPVEWAEHMARLSSVLPLLSSRLASRSCESHLSPALASAFFLEKWHLHSLPLQKWTKRVEGQSECQSLLRRKDPTRRGHPTAAQGCLTASISLLTVILSNIKRGREKWDWVWGSQTSLLFPGWGKLHPSFSVRGQDSFAFPSLLKLKGRSCDWKRVLEKRVLAYKASISEKYDLKSWPTENLGPSWAPRCGIATLGNHQVELGERKGAFGIATHLTPACLWPSKTRADWLLSNSVGLS